MPYDPQTYWQERFASQGSKYVGFVTDSLEQVEEQGNTFFRALRGKLPKHCRRLLDFGCGRGRLAQRLSRHCEEYHGTDICLGALQAASKPPKATYHWIDGDCLPFDDHFFDCIVCITVLQHIPDTQIGVWMNEIRRVACDAATVVILDNNPMNVQSAHMFTRPSAFYESHLGLCVSSVNPVVNDHYLLTGTMRC